MVGLILRWLLSSLALYEVFQPVCCGNNFQECGLRNEVDVDRSDNNTLLEYPWHVVLYKQFSSALPPEYACGGSVIDQNRILTAAHCVYNENTCDTENTTFIAVVGKYDSLWDYKRPAEQRFKVMEIKVPETYFGFFGRYSDDIAVLFLNESIKFSSAVMPVCIDWNAEFKQVFTHGTIVGWKLDENNKPSAKLAVAETEYYNFITCRNSVSKNFLRFVTSEKFCGSFFSITVSNRRSDGGGFVVPLNSTKNVEKYYLLGILSAKDRDSNLTSYTDVIKHLKWLKSVLTSDTNSELPALVADYGDDFQECGIRYPVNSHVPTINYGYKARHTEFPWHVPIYRQLTSDQPPEYICGGSIIHRKLILSAAHCFYNDTTFGIANATFMVIVGKYNRSWDYRDNFEQRFKVMEIKIPETYRSILNRFANDLAILVLNDSISFSSVVMPICIDWNPKINVQEMSDIGTVAGWGYTENRSLSDALMVAKFKYYNFTTCSNKFITEGFSNFITSDKFCAGSENGTTVDQGDSGGSLVFLRGSFGNKQQYYIRGIVSTKAISDTNVITLTDINKHLKWLNNSISPFAETEYCPVLSSNSVELEHCSVNNTAVDCRRLARVGTTAKILCKKSFHAEFPFRLYSDTECMNDHTWSSLTESCIDCGTRYKFSDFVPLIITSQDSGPKVVTELPWHVGIYIGNGHVTEGTIIHPKAVLTVARHLFNEENSSMIDAKLINVVKNELKFEVSKIYLKSTYVGLSNLHADDIAVLELNETISFSDYIMPACIDWAGNLQLHKKPYLPAIGSSERDKENIVKLSYVNLKRCRLMTSEADKEYLSYLTSDKWCALSEDGSLSTEDAGGSLSFPSYNEETGIQHYYLYGVISSKSKSGNIIGVTDVLYHIEWIKETMISIINSMVEN